MLVCTVHSVYRGQAIHLTLCFPSPHEGTFISFQPVFPSRILWRDRGHTSLCFVQVLIFNSCVSGAAQRQRLFPDRSSFHQWQDERDQTLACASAKFAGLWTPPGPTSGIPDDNSKYDLIVCRRKTYHKDDSMFIPLFRTLRSGQGL